MGAPNGRYEQVLWLLDSARIRGLTWRELADRGGLNHGQASGALSNLRDKGKVVRVDERRDECGVYLHINHMPAYQRSHKTHEEVYAAGVADGWRMGRLDLSATLATFLDEMTRAVQREHGLSATPPIGATWMNHPPHTITVMRRQLERAGGVSKEPPRLEPMPPGVVDITIHREIRR